MAGQQVATNDRWKTFTVQCHGGLNTSEDTFSLQPGEATQLVNFEPGIYGGYRRINGYAKYDASAVPGTGKILGIATWNGSPGGVIAARGNDVYFSSGSGWNTHINGATARTGAGRYHFTKYFLSTGRKIAMCDGVNPAATWDGSSYTLLNGTGSPSDPKYCAWFKGRLVLAGYTNNGGLQAITLTAPNTDSDFTAANGALEISVHDNIVGIRNFRETLYIFCERSLYQMTGNTSSDFLIEPVAQIGCLAHDSIQEINGDVVYLAPDGVRTVSGTMKIGDVELGTLSKPILSIAANLFSAAGSDADNIISTCVRNKNQYRLFYNTSTQQDSDGLGILGAVRPGKQPMTQFGTYISVWEWASLQGIRPSCADSDYIGGIETVVHGGYDGYVYEQESGSSFDGANISAFCKTPPFMFDDPELRKLIEKVTIHYRVEGKADINEQTILEYNDPDVLQPNPNVYFPGGGTLYFYTDSASTYGGAKYGGNQDQKTTQNTQGSGKIVQFQFSSIDTNPSYSIQALTIQYRLLGRR